MVDYPRIVALVLGAVLTPVAVGVSLALLPFAGPLLLYGGVGALLAYGPDGPGWTMGLYLTAGLVLATLVVAGPGDALEELQHGSGMVVVTLIFAGAPALVGGCLGGWIGLFCYRKRNPED